MTGVGERIDALLADLNVSGWRVRSEHGCDGTEEGCAATCPVPVQEQVSPEEIRNGLLDLLAQPTADEAEVIPGGPRYDPPNHPESGFYAGDRATADEAEGPLIDPQGHQTELLGYGGDGCGDDDTADEAEGDEREALAGDRLAAVVAAINALHRPREVTVFAGPTKGSKTTVCSACEMSEPDWPCPTVAALRAALATPPAPERNGEGGGSDG